MKSLRSNRGASPTVRGCEWLNICLCYEFFCPLSFSLINFLEQTLGTDHNFLPLFELARCGCLGPKTPDKLITLLSSPSFMDFSKTGNDFSTFVPVTRPTERENKPLMSYSCRGRLQAGPSSPLSLGVVVPLLCRAPETCQADSTMPPLNLRTTLTL